MATDSAPLSGALATDPPARSGLRIAYERVRTYIEPRRRQALGLILLLAAFCNFYELQRNGFANLYYSAAIRSMLESWHNFFFVAFDPGGFVTVDKPPLGFWIQAASAKLFGYSGFSILLPEALAGVISVGVLYVLVRRIFGSVAGLLAALFLAITPVSVVTNRNNTIDSLLVLTVLLGGLGRLPRGRSAAACAGCCSRAVAGRPRLQHQDAGSVSGRAGLRRWSICSARRAAGGRASGTWSSPAG